MATGGKNNRIKEFLRRKFCIFQSLSLFVSQEPTNLTTFTVSLKSVDAVVVGRSEAKKNTELLARVNTKLLDQGRRLLTTRMIIIIIIIIMIIMIIIIIK